MKMCGGGRMWAQPWKSMHRVGASGRNTQRGTAGIQLPLSYPVHSNHWFQTWVPVSHPKGICTKRQATPTNKYHQALPPHLGAVTPATTWLSCAVR